MKLSLKDIDGFWKNKTTFYTVSELKLILTTINESTYNLVIIDKTKHKTEQEFISENSLLDFIKYYI